MKTLTNIWKWLNGNKTIIFSSLLAGLEVTFIKKHIPPETFEVLQWGIGSLAALSLGHHISKGYFTTKVGNEGQEVKSDPLKNKNVQL